MYHWNDQPLSVRSISSKLFLKKGALEMLFWSVLNLVDCKQCFCRVLVCVFVFNLSLTILCPSPFPTSFTKNFLGLMPIPCQYYPGVRKAYAAVMIVCMRPIMVSGHPMIEYALWPGLPRSEKGRESTEKLPAKVVRASLGPDTQGNNLKGLLRAREELRSMLREEEQAKAR